MEEGFSEGYSIKVDGNILDLSIGPLETESDILHAKRWAEEVMRLAKKAYEESGIKLRSLIDISRIKKYRVEGFQILAEVLVRDAQFDDKIATYGGTKEVVASQDAMAALSGRDNIRHFEDRKAAEEWIFEDSK